MGDAISHACLPGLILAFLLFNSKESWALMLGEQNEVQDDFELICFDLVSSPSTPGAYLYKNEGDRHMYDENLEEDRKINVERVIGSNGNKSLDLMKKLNDYLGNK